MEWLNKIMKDPVGGELYGKLALLALVIGLLVLAI